MEKKYEKDIEINHLRNHIDRAFMTSMIAYVATFAYAIDSCVFSPFAPTLIAPGTVLSASELSATTFHIGASISDLLGHNTYNNSDDLSKYEK